jgi:outer membrane protein with beta-barrel domain
MKYSSSALSGRPGRSRDYPPVSFLLPLLRRGVLWIAVLAAVTAVFAADDSGSPAGDSPQDQKSSTGVSSSSSTDTFSRPIPRIWLGISGNCTPLRLVTVGTNTNATTGEVVSSTAANGLAGVGLNLNVRITSAFWASIGGVYRFTGYDYTDSVNDTLGTVYTQRARAHLIDMPVMVRYNGERFNISKYTFYELGGAVRYALPEKVSQVAVNENGLIASGAPPTGIRFTKMIEGVIAGAGLTAKDEFGIVVAPEVRYTRWLGNTFDGNSVSTQHNQLEIAITFGY